jgi:hypothetical protein
MSQPKIQKKLLILYIDCTNEEMQQMKEDLFFALSCVTQYRFIITNKRIESLGKQDLIEILAKLGVSLDIPPSAVKDST